MHSNSIFEILVNWRNFRLKLFFQGIVVGLLAGTVVVLFRLILEQSYWGLQHLYGLLRSGSPWLLFVWAIVLVFIAYLLGTMVQKQTLIGGSGIPQVKGVVAGHLQMNWLAIIVWKFIGGVLAIGSGLSLGREGPSIQLGAAAGQGINRLFKGLPVEEKILITSGAGAGLAAAFNAPLAGVIFSLEELHKNFSPPVLMSCMAASLSADFISKHFFGIEPIFNFGILPQLPFKYYVHLIILGLVLGLLGVLFNRSLLKAQDIYKKQTLIPPRYLAIVPLLLSIPVGLYLPVCLGGGNDLINSLSQGHFGIALLLTLVVVKFIFTIISYGSGVPGGIFLPLLVIGALIGGISGNAAVFFSHLDPQYVNNFVVFAMAGYFTAIVKSPITGSILITEMTGSFTHLLPVIIVSMTAYVTSDILKGKPIYDELLQRILRKEKDISESDKRSGQTLLEIAVGLNSNLDNRRVKEVKWPSNCLLVSIRRGEEEIIPHGNTTILAGDYLNILTSQDQAPQTYKLMQLMAEAIPC